MKIRDLIDPCGGYLTCSVAAALFCGCESGSYSSNYEASPRNSIPLTTLAAPAASAALWKAKPADRESYAAVDENPFYAAADEPLSTFSIDVDTASYANVRRLLREDQQVPPGAVRIEEMVNYFHYRHPGPGGDEPFSVEIAVAGSPWGPGHPPPRDRPGGDRRGLG